ncbi:MAG TPA: hypothetical protein VHA30_02570, partial [Patescibacteria group bacterium]|nr:hypothetical protein [Patescibacteria group bacterium]
MKLKTNIIFGFFLGLGFLVLPHFAAAYNAGFVTSSYTATTPEGTKTYTDYFWYPTNTAAATYNYGNGAVSQVALNAPMAGNNHPVVIYVHGDGGCGIVSVFITEELAKAGYVVAAINYLDAGTNCGGDGGTVPGEPSYSNASAWNDQSYIYRYDDTETLINQLVLLNATNSSFLYQSMNLNRLGFMGHSLGGYTGDAMLGAWPSWLDTRFRAGLLLSPYSQPFTLSQNQPINIKTPVMLQGGTQDLGITPYLPGFYNVLQSPKYFLVLNGAGHLAWTNITCFGTTSSDDCLATSTTAAAIVAYGKSFLDTYVAGTSGSVNTSSSSA